VDEFFCSQVVANEILVAAEKEDGDVGFDEFWEEGY